MFANLVQHIDALETKLWEQRELRKWVRPAEWSSEKIAEMEIELAKLTE